MSGSEGNVRGSDRVSRGGSEVGGGTGPVLRRAGVRPTCTSSLVIFGGTGDLSRRKLIPALLRLKAGGYLPSDLHLIITGRRELTKEQLIALFRESFDHRPESCSLLEKGLEDLAPRLRYIRVDPQEEGAAAHLGRSLQQIEGEGAAPVRLFYLALPPEQMPAFLPLLAEPLGRDKDSHCPSRVLVEKPFGHDLASAARLNDALLRIANEDQILRIDHYLGKEAVQNILVLRFANLLFEPLWTRNYIDHVQISFSESIGVGARGAFYDQTGILRDVVQNHLLQVLSLTAMEPPISGSAADIRREKMKILRALRPITSQMVAHQTVRGRYERTSLMKGYLEEEKVDPQSQTETYTALKAYVDTWRWSGVPFYLRAGKRLSSNLTEIVVYFKQVPHGLFTSIGGQELPSNVLVLRVQPDEGIHLLVQTKKPGMALELAPVQLNFSYQESFGSYRPDAYERLLLDALYGDLSLFICNEEIELAWRFVDPIVEAWYKLGHPVLHGYPCGSEGPLAAHDLLHADGREWRPLPVPPKQGG